MTTIAMLRVSDKNKQDNESQRIRIIEYAKANDITIDKWYEDSGSGAKPWSETMWAELLPEYKDATVLVTDFSRFSRDGARTFQLKSLCEERNIQLYDIHMQCNPFEDTTVLYIQSMLSELELEKIKMRSKAGHNNRAKRGKGTGYGFLPSGEINLREYTLLIWIIEARYNKKSFANIAKDLNSLKVRTRDGKLWSKMWIYKLYNSPKVQNIIQYQLKRQDAQGCEDLHCELHDTYQPIGDDAYWEMIQSYTKPVSEETGFKLFNKDKTDFITFTWHSFETFESIITDSYEMFWGPEE